MDENEIQLKCFHSIYSFYARPRRTVICKVYYDILKMTFIRTQRFFIAIATIEYSIPISTGQHNGGAIKPGVIYIGCIKL